MTSTFAADATFTKDGRAEIVTRDTTRDIARCDRARLREECTPYTKQAFARQYTVDANGRCLRFLTLEDATRCYEAAQ